MLLLDCNQPECMHMQLSIGKQCFTYSYSQLTYQFTVMFCIGCGDSSKCVLVGPGLQDSLSLSRPSSADDGSRHTLPMPPSTMSNGHSRPNGNHMQVHGASNGLQHSSEAGTFRAINAVHYSIFIMHGSHTYAYYYCCASSALGSTSQALRLCMCNNQSSFPWLTRMPSVYAFLCL